MSALRYRTPGGVGMISGTGALQELSAELSTRDRVLLITSPSAGRTKAYETLVAALGERVVAQYTGSAAGVPENTVSETLAIAASAGPDTVVAFGGASSIDTAKAVVLRRSEAQETSRFAAVPSTLGGAEFTDFAGMSVGGRKTAVRDRRMRPGLVVHSPEVLLETPGRLLRESIGNAISHCLEGLLSAQATPVSDAFYSHGLSLLLSAGDPGQDLRRLSTLQTGAAMAAMEPVAMGRAHGIVHAAVELTGSRHGATHAIVSVHALREAGRLRQDAVDKFQIMARTVGVQPAADTSVTADRIAHRLWSFFDTLRVPRSLAELGVAEQQLAQVVDKLEEDGRADDAVAEILRSSWRGERPDVTEGL